MAKTAEFTFLRVMNGTTYFSRVTVAPGTVAGVLIGTPDTSVPAAWLDAARAGAESASAKHIELGGTQTGLIIDQVIGTEVDTTENAVEIAAYCAAWKALGRHESQLVVAFNGEWRVSYIASKST
ncbi:MAG TPA: hypothetical protein VGE76_15550 [Opitutaceae bacterium]